VAEWAVMGRLVGRDARVAAKAAKKLKQAVRKVDVPAVGDEWRHDYHDPGTGKFAPLGYVTPGKLKGLLSPDAKARGEVTGQIADEIRKESDLLFDWREATMLGDNFKASQIASRIRANVIGARPVLDGTPERQNERNAWDLASRELGRMVPQAAKAVPQTRSPGSISPSTPEAIREAARVNGKVRARVGDPGRMRRFGTGDVLEVGYKNDEFGFVYVVGANGKTRKFLMRWDRLDGFSEEGERGEQFMAPSEIAAAVRAADGPVAVRIGDNRLNFHAGLFRGDRIDVTYVDDTFALVGNQRVRWERLDAVLPNAAAPQTPDTPDVPSLKVGDDGYVVDPLERGVNVQLPPELAARLQEATKFTGGLPPSEDPAQVARDIETFLRSYDGGNAGERAAGIGNNWTDDGSVAELGAETGPGTPIIVQARYRPDDIETDPTMMTDMVSGEGETRLRPGSDVRVVGMRVQAHGEWHDIWPNETAEPEVPEAPEVQAPGLPSGRLRTPIPMDVPRTGIERDTAAKGGDRRSGLSGEPFELSADKSQWLHLDGTPVSEKELRDNRMMPPELAGDLDAEWELANAIADYDAFEGAERDQFLADMLSKNGDWGGEVPSSAQVDAWMEARRAGEAANPDAESVLYGSTRELLDDIPEGVLWDPAGGMYVDPDGDPLDADQVEALGLDPSLQNVPEGMPEWTPPVEAPPDVPEPSPEVPETPQAPSTAPEVVPTPGGTPIRTEGIETTGLTTKPMVAQDGYVRQSADGEYYELVELDDGTFEWMFDFDIVDGLEVGLPDPNRVYDLDAEYEAAQRWLDRSEEMGSVYPPGEREAFLKESVAIGANWIAPDGTVIVPSNAQIDAWLADRAARDAGGVPPVDGPDVPDGVLYDPARNLYVDPDGNPLDADRVEELGLDPSLISVPEGMPEWTGDDLDTVRAQVASILGQDTLPEFGTPEFEAQKQAFVAFTKGDKDRLNEFGTDGWMRAADLMLIEKNAQGNIQSPAESMVLKALQVEGFPMSGTALDADQYRDVVDALTITGPDVDALRELLNDPIGAASPQVVAYMLQRMRDRQTDLSRPQTADEQRDLLLLKRLTTAIDYEIGDATLDLSSPFQFPNGDLNNALEVTGWAPIVNALLSTDAVQAERRFDLALYVYGASRGNDDLQVAAGGWVQSELDNLKARFPEVYARWFDEQNGTLTGLNESTLGIWLGTQAQTARKWTPDYEAQVRTAPKPVDLNDPTKGVDTTNLDEMVDLEDRFQQMLVEAGDSLATRMNIRVAAMNAAAEFYALTDDSIGLAFAAEHLTQLQKMGWTGPDPTSSRMVTARRLKNLDWPKAVLGEPSPEKDDRMIAMMLFSQLTEPPQTASGYGPQPPRMEESLALQLLDALDRAAARTDDPDSAVMYEALRSEVQAGLDGFAFVTTKLDETDFFSVDGVDNWLEKTGWKNQLIAPNAQREALAAQLVAITPGLKQKKAVAEWLAQNNVPVGVADPTNNPFGKHLKYPPTPKRNLLQVQFRDIDPDASSAPSSDAMLKVSIAKELASIAAASGDLQTRDEWLEQVTEWEAYAATLTDPDEKGIDPGTAAFLSDVKDAGERIDWETLREAVIDLDDGFLMNWMAGAQVAAELADQNPALGAFISHAIGGYGDMIRDALEEADLEFDGDSAATVWQEFMNGAAEVNKLKSQMPSWTNQVRTLGPTESIQSYMTASGWDQVLDALHDADLEYPTETISEVLGGLMQTAEKAGRKKDMRDWIASRFQFEYLDPETKAEWQAVMEYGPTGSWTTSMFGTPENADEIALAALSEGQDRVKLTAILDPHMEQLDVFLEAVNVTPAGSDDRVTAASIDEALTAYQANPLDDAARLEAGRQLEAALLKALTGDKVALSTLGALDALTRSVKAGETVQPRAVAKELMKKPKRPGRQRKPMAMVSREDSWADADSQPISFVDAMDEVVANPSAGSVFSYDSDRVEGLQVRTRGVSYRDENGDVFDATQFQFKVTDGHEDDMLTFMEDGGRSLGTLLIAGEHDGTVDLDPESDLKHGFVYEETERADTLVKEVTLADGRRAVIAYHKVDVIDSSYEAYDTESEDPRAFKNKVQVYVLDGGQPVEQADVDALFEQMGIPTGYPSPEAQTAYARSLMARTFSTKGAVNDGVERAQTLLGVAPEDITFERVGNRLVPMIPEAAAERLAEETDVAGFIHDLSSGINEDTIVAMLAGDNEGLLATTTRWSEGIGGEGMSSDTDVMTGGADYVFLRQKNTSALGEGASKRVYVDRKSVLRRLDWYAYDHDRYGTQAESAIRNRDNVEQLKVNGLGDQETMVRRSVPVSEWTGMSLDPARRERILTRLEERGITEINGIPVAEFLTKPTDRVSIPGTDEVLGNPAPAGAKMLLNDLVDEGSIDFADIPKDLQVGMKIKTGGISFTVTDTGIKPDNPESAKALDSIGD
jgi:hypothetical protein